MIVKAKVRRQVITGNRESLYLDWYPPIRHPETGKTTRREFLNLFIFSTIEHEEIQYKDKKGINRKRIIPVLKKQSINNIKKEPKERKLSALEIQHNKNTEDLAEFIRQKRENEVNKYEIYTLLELEQIKIIKLREQSFIDYYQAQADDKKCKNRQIWLASLKYFKSFIGERDIKFNEIDEALCNNYRTYISSATRIKNKERGLAQNSKSSYFNKFKSVLKSAFNYGYFQVNLGSRIGCLKEEDPIKDTLTLEELNKLVKTECADPVLKKACLLSALTGLRFSDIHKLIWREIEFVEGDGYYIRFRQKKTNKKSKIPITAQAYSLLGVPRDPESRIFIGLNYSSYMNRNLYQWIAAAGITKDISFHNFRYTHATLQHELGSEILTIKELLGHKNIKMTEKYITVFEKEMRAAVNLLKLEGL